MIVIYKQENDSVALLIPSKACLMEYTLEEIALKDVPEGLPFWMVDRTELPEDPTFFEAWEIPEDYREPDGYGSPFSTFKEIRNAQSQ